MQNVFRLSSSPNPASVFSTERTPGYGFVHSVAKFVDNHILYADSRCPYCCVFNRLLR